MSATKNKWIGGIVIFIIGILVGFFSAKKWFAPEPPAPNKPSIVTIIKGQPGVITVSNELFYPNYFTALIIATGQGQAEYTVQRPDRWKPREKQHFIGVGMGASLCNQGLLYNGYVSYRYRLYKDISFMAITDIGAGGPQFNVGIKLGMEMGVK